MLKGVTVVDQNRNRCKSDLGQLGIWTGFWGANTVRDTWFFCLCMCRWKYGWLLLLPETMFYPNLQRQTKSKLESDKSTYHHNPTPTRMELKFSPILLHLFSPLHLILLMSLEIRPWHKRWGAWTCSEPKVIWWR